MSSFDKRKNAFENKFAHDSELEFKVEARCCKLFGLWIAEKLGLEGDDADEYAKTVIMANLEEPGFDDVKRKIAPDLKEKNIDLSDHIIDTELTRFTELAKEEIMNEMDDL